MYKNVILICICILFCNVLCFADFTKGKVVKEANNYFIISAGSFLRARTNDLFWVKRTIQGRSIKVGIAKVDQVYYDSSKVKYLFKPPIGIINVNDDVFLASLPRKDYSESYLKDKIKSDYTKSLWDNLLEDCIIFLQKKYNKSYARFMLSKYFLRFGLYKNALINLLVAEKKSLALETYERLDLYNLLGILEYKFNRKKQAMVFLDKVINFKFVVKQNTPINKKLDIDIFDESIKEDNNKAISIRERLLEKKLKLSRKVGALLKGFILEKDGYGVFKDLMISDIKIDREVLEASADIVRFFPKIKKDFILYIENILKKRK